jgi:hypothetical protein
MLKINRLKHILIGKGIQFSQNSSAIGLGKHQFGAIAIPGTFPFTILPLRT